MTDIKKVQTQIDTIKNVFGIDVYYIDTENGIIVSSDGCQDCGDTHRKGWCL